MTRASIPAEVEFSRYEFKYLLPLRQREAIEGEISHFMQVDGHVDDALNNQYLVRSLYFDTPAAANFHEKIDGIRTRRKYRIRTYADAVGAPTFLEAKGRHNERTYKERIEIDRDEVHHFLNPESWMTLLGSYPNVPLVNCFVFDALRKRLRPCVLVDYLRRPHTSHFDMNFRVTFDSHLRAMGADELFPSEYGGFRSCVSGWTILEIKFNRRIPAWFHRILQAHEMRRLSISKFVVGMKVCELAVDLS